MDRSDRMLALEKSLTGLVQRLIRLERVAEAASFYLCAGEIDRAVCRADLVEALDAVNKTKTTRPTTKECK